MEWSTRPPKLSMRWRSSSGSQARSSPSYSKTANRDLTIALVGQPPTSRKPACCGRQVVVDSRSLGEETRSWYHLQLASTSPFSKGGFRKWLSSEAHDGKTKSSAK